MTRLAGYLAEHRSPVRQPVHEYAAVAQRFGSAEGRADHDRHIRQHDCVESIRYQPEYEAFGGLEAVGAAERHFTVSSRIALRLVAADTSMEVRAGVAVAALVIALGVWEPDMARVGRLLAAIRDHWDPPENRKRHACGYRDQRPVLLEQVPRRWLMATAGSDQQGSGPTTEWLRSISQLRSELVSLQSMGLFAPVTARTPAALTKPEMPAGHRAVLLVLLRCVHLLHNRLGLVSSREAYLRYLVGATLTDLTEKGRRI
jgi:thiopeptide-type bacteriocin biosynthesis protein